MKIRNGFVSNSSSTAFIFTRDKPFIPDEITLTLDDLGLVSIKTFKDLDEYARLMFDESLEHFEENDNSQPCIIRTAAEALRQGEGIILGCMHNKEAYLRAIEKATSTICLFEEDV